MRPVIDTIKNVVNQIDGITSGADFERDIAVAKDSPVTSTTSDVKRGSKIFKIWLEFWVYSSAELAVGVSNAVDLYIWKNPGNNLTPPTPTSQGSSNEKKYIFKSWKGLIGARTQGSQPYTWKGWIKIPRVYQRMGTDDTISLVSRAIGSNAVVCMIAVYKWYS